MRKDSSWTESYIAGIDEAGRGPLAGPVAVGCVLVRRAHVRAVFSKLKKMGLHDSKQVTEERRELLFLEIQNLQKEGKLTYHVSLISSSHITRFGISHAIRTGIKKNIKKLSIEDKVSQVELELDGALTIPELKWKKASIIIKGDTIKSSIMIASIMAKVTRDRHMKKLAKKYPLYLFDKHKGYGTLEHRRLIKAHGICPEHRELWCRSARFE